MSTSHFSTEELADLGARHLWMHFTRMGAYSTEQLLIIDSGKGCWLMDSQGKRYLDGLSGLFTVQVGHGRQELVEAAGRQLNQLSYFPIWGYAHPSAIELAARLASLAPGDLNRVFFTSSGSEAVESAWKLARQYFKITGQPQRYKVISRHLAYHGTTLGALSISGIPAHREPFEPLLIPGVSHVPNTNQYRPWVESASDEAFGLQCADAIAAAIEKEGPETVAAVFLEPLQNSGGCFVPPPGYFKRVREICDRYGVLLVSDEVICSYGRLGTMFGCERYGYQPDIIISAKGLTSGYAPLGAMIASDRLMTPFLAEEQSFLHGFTFGGHPLSCAIALANIDVLENEQLLAHVKKNEKVLERMLWRLHDDVPMVGDVRGQGYFWAIELVRDKKNKVGFAKEEREKLLRGFLSPRLVEEGLICRADDRGDPVLQFAPPLIAGEEEFAHIDRILRKVLSEAKDRFNN